MANDPSDPNSGLYPGGKVRHRLVPLNLAAILVFSSLMLLALYLPMLLALRFTRPSQIQTSYSHGSGSRSGVGMGTEKLGAGGGKTGVRAEEYEDGESDKEGGLKEGGDETGSRRRRR